MSSSMNTILIIGGTSGIGHAFTERFHSQGKKVIITGRRQDRLDSIKNSLKGVESYTFDMTDFDNASSHVEKLFKQFPDIDTVWINGGMQGLSSIKDVNSTTDAKVLREINTNFTAPLVLARHIIPKLMAQKKETTFMITSSGLGFAPLGGFFPVYCPTKAGIHQYMVGLRQALKDTNVNVVELVPPYVATELDSDFKESMAAVTPMKLEDYVNESFEILDGSSAKDLKEVAAGTAKPRVEAWRKGTGQYLIDSKLGG